MKSHKDLIVWQNSIAMVTNNDKITGTFPNEELYSLANQIRRYAVSIPSKIIEGSAGNSEKEFIRFLYISPGSCTELDTPFRMTRNLHFQSEDCFQKIVEQNSSIGKMLHGLINAIKNRTNHIHKSLTTNH